MAVKQIIFEGNNMNNTLQSLKNRIVILRAKMSPHTLERRVATGIAVEDPAAKKLLLIVKSRGPYKEQMWCVPGGKPEPNETLEKCAIREIQEETGLKIKLIKKVSTDSDVTLVNDKPIYYQFHNYFAHPIKGVARPGDDSARTEWFSKEEIKKLKLSVPTKRFLKKIGYL